MFNIVFNISKEFGLKTQADAVVDVECMGLDSPAMLEIKNWLLFGLLDDEAEAWPLCSSSQLPRASTVKQPAHQVLGSMRNYSRRIAPRDGSVGGAQSSVGQVASRSRQPLGEHQR